jgi:NAD(P)-dependent dehydrogenase (short-subunit alcohol dehydrogenase family)
MHCSTDRSRQIQPEVVMRRVLVTGANRGIGLEMTRQLLARGDRVYATARKPAQATALNKLAFAHPGKLTMLPLDVTKPTSIDELARELAIVTDALDTLVNNAGVLPQGERYGELDPRTLDSTFAANAMGPLLVTQALTRYLERGERPVVMSVSSELGSIAERDSFYTPSYCISKAALNMAMRLTALELSARGIVVFVAHPGWVKTDMGGARAEVEPADSVAGLLRLLDQATPKQAGRFLTWDGHELPW